MFSHLLYFLWVQEGPIQLCMEGELTTCCSLIHLFFFYLEATPGENIAPQLKC